MGPSELDVVSTELDAAIASHVARDSAMQQRATILIGAASITGALQVETTLGWATFFSVLLSLFAAVGGVVVVWPRVGNGLDIRVTRTKFQELPLDQARSALIDVKLEILEEDEDSLLRRGRWARAAFLAVTISIAIAVFAAALSPAASSSEPSPTPSSSSTHGK